eukprot:UN23157
MKPPLPNEPMYRKRSIDNNTTTNHYSRNNSFDTPPSKKRLPNHQQQNSKIISNLLNRKMIPNPKAIPHFNNSLSFFIAIIRQMDHYRLEREVEQARLLRKSLEKKNP